tara:strand:- start:183872 stop:184414 length:543 start_codon:yes stop_codon:yes gene_type:complete
LHEVCDVQRNPVLQSVDEWLADYESEPVQAHNYKPHGRVRAVAETQAPTLCLCFDHHRTTRDGRLVLAFLDPEGRECVAFFNVDIRRQRGPDKGKSYRSGIGGQFLPPVRGRFRAFWLEVVGTPPRRWSEVHHELHRLKAFHFTGIVEAAEAECGQYFRVKKLRQSFDKESTTVRQSFDK